MACRPYGCPCWRRGVACHPYNGPRWDRGGACHPYGCPRWRRGGACHGRGGACHPLIDKEINKKIKEAGKGENGEWNGKPFFRSECPVCGKQHAFMLKGPEDGAGTCPSTGGEVTAPPPDGYRIAARGGAYVLEWLRDGRA